MKSKILFALLLFTRVLCAQSFDLTPDGFKTVAGEDYLVLEYPERTQEQLYKEVLIYLNTIYKSPKNVLSTVENETITINGHSANRVRRNSLHVFDLDYSIVIRFKEGRFRIDSPSVSMTNWFDGKKQKLYISMDKRGVFNSTSFGIYKNGKLKHKKAKEDLEAYFTTYFLGLISAMESSPNDDW